MTFVTPTTASTPTEREAVLSAAFTAVGTVPTGRVSAIDRLLMRAGLLLLTVGRTRALSPRIAREPHRAFGPHRGSEVLRPFV